MTTLQTLMLDLAKVVSDTREGVLTGVIDGNTVVDSDAPDQYEAWKGGTFFMDGASSAGLTSRVTRYSSGTFTLFDSASAGVGENYAVTEYQIQALKSAINDALRHMKVPRIDTTHTATDGVATLTGVSDVRQVYVDDVRSYRWEEVDGAIRFDDDTTEGDLKLWYLAEHGVLDDYTDTLDPRVDPVLVVTIAARVIWERLFRKNPADNGILNSLNKALQDEARLLSRHNQKLWSRDPYLAGW